MIDHDCLMILDFICVKWMPHEVNGRSFLASVSPNGEGMKIYHWYNLRNIYIDVIYMKITENN